MGGILPSDNIPSIPRIKATQYLFYITNIDPCHLMCFKSIKLKIIQIIGSEQIQKSDSTA